MWPFRSRIRAQAAPAGGGADATAIAVEALQREASGAAVDSAALAVAEACIGLWARSLASATVQPRSLALGGLSAPVLALAGRMLATRGNAVFLIEVRAGRVMLHAASGWDPRGGYRPETRRYRLTMAGPDGIATRTVSGEAVLHFAVNATEATPWRGQSPLSRSRATADLAARVEKQLDSESRFPPSRLIRQESMTGGDPRTIEAMRERLTKGGIGFFPHEYGGPTRVGADPSAVMEALRTHAGHDICAAFGTSPALFSPAGDGSGQREAWRRWWAGTVVPLGRLVEDELRAKLDAGATLTFDALRASDEDGRSRAVSRRATAFKTFMDAGIGRDEALRLAGIER